MEREHFNNLSLNVLNVNCQSLIYQLFIIFVPHADNAFTVVFALMTLKTTDLNKAVFEKVQELIPSFRPTQVIADFEEAPTAAVRCFRR